MSSLISFDMGSESDPIFDGCSEMELYFVCQVNLLVVARLQVDDLLNTSEKIYKIQRPSQDMFIPVYRWWYGLSRHNTTTNLQRLYYHSHKLLQANTLQSPQKNRLKKHLQRSLSGLRKLIETYRNDAATVARIKCLIEETGDFLPEESKTESNVYNAR